MALHAPALILFPFIAMSASAQNAFDLHIVLSDKKWDFPAHINKLDAQGLSLLRRGKLKRAIHVLDRSLKIMPHNPRALADRGTAWLGLRDLDRGLQDYEQALALEPELGPSLSAGMSRAYHQRGQDRIKAGDIGAAFSDLAAYIRLEGRSAPAYAEVGRIAYLGGQFESCVSYADYALEADSRFPGGHADRGLCLAALGKPSEALPDLDEALRLDPARVDLVAARARVYAALGRQEDALREAQRALELDPGLKQQMLPLIKEASGKARQ